MVASWLMLMSFQNYSNGMGGSEISLSFLSLVKEIDPFHFDYSCFLMFKGYTLISHAWYKLVPSGMVALIHKEDLPSDVSSLNSFIWIISAIGVLK